MGTLWRQSKWAVTSSLYNCTCSFPIACLHNCAQNIKMFTFEPQDILHVSFAKEYTMVFVRANAS